MSDLNLETILAAGRTRRRPPDIQAARSREQARRGASAQTRAHKALTYLYPDEYRQLYLQALAQVNGECGPLPGDEVAS